MLAPELHWAHQIVVTSVCWPKDPGTGQPTQCSNCTRLLGHESKRYVMSLDDFELCVSIGSEFVRDSPPCPQGRRKVLGIFGGDPVLLPDFPEYVEIMCGKVRDSWHRGLWTSQDWRNYRHPRYGALRPHVEKLLGHPNGEVYDRNRGQQRSGGYLNFNPHAETMRVEHQPVLVSISDVIQDEARKWHFINNCWVNREWSAAYAYDHQNRPRFYFCEVASAFDRIMRLDIGLPVNSRCWSGSIDLVPAEGGGLRPTGKFAAQIAACCTRCGASLPLPGRKDREWRDDISPSNLARLREVGSPMVKRGDLVNFDMDAIASYQAEQNQQGWQPNRYIK